MPHINQSKRWFHSKSEGLFICRAVVRCLPSLHMSRCAIGTRARCFKTHSWSLGNLAWRLVPSYQSDYSCEVLTTALRHLRLPAGSVTNRFWSIRRWMVWHRVFVALRGWWYHLIAGWRQRSKAACTHWRCRIRAVERLRTIADGMVGHYYTRKFIRIVRQVWDFQR